MFKSIYEAMLFRLLAKELGIKRGGKIRLDSLALSEYALKVFSNNEIVTVKDAVLAYCLHKPTPGIGNGTWEDFLHAVS